MPGQQRQQAGQHAALVVFELANPGVAGDDLLLRRQAVDGRLGNARRLALLEAADALHEELVERHGRDSQELEALEERVAIVLGLVQHAAVEREPGQLTIQVQRRIVEIGRVRGFARDGAVGSLLDRRGNHLECHAACPR